MIFADPGSTLCVTVDYGYEGEIRSESSPDNICLDKTTTIQYMTKQPNILFITADQWRGDCLSAAGHPLVKTPNLDKLAASGVFFKNHFANAAPCSPARACLYTGLYQMNNRVCTNGSPLDNRHDTLAKALRRLGYEPTLFGYTDQSGDPNIVHANDPSLRTYEGVLPGFFARTRVMEDQIIWRSWLEQHGYDGALRSATSEFHIPTTGVDDPPTSKPPVYKAEHTDTAFLVGEFKRWLAEQALNSNSESAHNSNAWCAHISFLRPHPPFVVPPPYNDMYNISDIKMPIGVDAESDVDHPLLTFLRERISKENFIPGANGLVSDWSADDLRQIAAVYYGMCTEVDAQLGQILASLDAHDQTQNTVIVFTSDHGEQMGDHALLGKYGFFDSSYKIPLVISDPRAPSAHGRVINEFTEAVDVMPTVLDMLSADVPAQLDGQSLKMLMDQSTGSQWRKTVHWEYDFRDVVSNRAEQYFDLPSQACNMAVSRSDKFKYVHFAGLPSLLFDLEIDPFETRNVINEPEYQTAARLCAEELLSWRAQHLDQTLALSSIGEHGLTSGNREPNYTYQPD